MKNDNKKVLDKIRKLLSMAERSAGNEAEAAISAKMAEALLRKHNLTHSDITLEEAIDDIKQNTATELKWTAGRTPVWVNCIAISLADLYDAHVLFTKAVDGNDSHVQKRQCHLTFIGSELDATIAKEMFLYLYKTINRLTDEFYKTAEAPTGKARTIKASFRKGASLTIAARIKNIIADKEKAYVSTGTGLMVVKKDAIAKHLGFTPEYETKKRASATHDSAFAAGVEKGKSVSLNNQVTDKSNPITSIAGIPL